MGVVVGVRMDSHDIYANGTIYIGGDVIFGVLQIWRVNRDAPNIEAPNRAASQYTVACQNSEAAQI